MPWYEIAGRWTLTLAALWLAYTALEYAACLVGMAAEAWRRRMIRKGWGKN